MQMDREESWKGMGAQVKTIYKQIHSRKIWIEGSID